MLLKEFNKYSSNPSKLEELNYIQVLHEIVELSKPAIKVLNYLRIVKGNREELEIEIKDCLEFTSYTSTVNVYKGIKELLEKEFIYRKLDSKSYFLNVNKIK